MTSHVIESAKVDRLLTQVDCRITSLARRRDAGTISECKAEELKQAIELRAELTKSTGKILPSTPSLAAGKKPRYRSVR